MACKLCASSSCHAGSIIALLLLLVPLLLTVKLFRLRHAAAAVAMVACNSAPTTRL
jgi:hypothetical protein